MNFGALPEGKVGLGIPHGAPPPLVWGTQIIQEFRGPLNIQRAERAEQVRWREDFSSV